VLPSVAYADYYTVRHKNTPTFINRNLKTDDQIFIRESRYCFQCVLAVAIFSVRLSVTRVNQSKTVQD